MKYRLYVEFETPDSVTERGVNSLYERIKKPLVRFIQETLGGEWIRIELDVDK